MHDRLRCNPAAAVTGTAAAAVDHQDHAGRNQNPQGTAGGNGGGGQRILLLRGKLSPVYRRRFFNIPDLSEKFAIAAKEEESGRIYYINFYRSDKNSSFSQ
jgi:hypothetical protein